MDEKKSPEDKKSGLRGEYDGVGPRFPERGGTAQLEKSYALSN